VGSQGFWQLWGATASWAVPHLIPPVGLRLGGKMPGGEACLIPPALVLPAVGLSASLQGREQSGWEKPLCAGLCLFLPSVFPGGAIHTLVSCP